MADGQAMFGPQGRKTTCGHKVLLDTDLAAIYGVAVKALNQAVKRNRARFPEDFVFRLSAEEAESLRSQIVTLDARGLGFEEAQVRRSM